MFKNPQDIASRLFQHFTPTVTKFCQLTHLLRISYEKLIKISRFLCRQLKLKIKRVMLSTNTRLHVCDVILWCLFCDAQILQKLVPNFGFTEKEQIDHIGVLQTPIIFSLSMLARFVMFVMMFFITFSSKWTLFKIYVLFQIEV